VFFVLSKIAFLILRPSNAVIVAMGLGLLLRRTRFRRIGILSFTLGFAGLVIAGWTSLSTLLLRPLETRFPRADTLEVPPTGIIVLGGSVDTAASTEHGTVEMIDGAERLAAAVRLAAAYPASKVIYTGGHGGYVDGEQAEAAIAGPLLQSFGIAPGRIVLETASRNTVENATLTYDLVRPEPGDSWLLVTSAFHMPRAMGVFRTAGWTNVSPYPVDFRTLDGAPVLGRQYASEGLFLTDLAVKEWLGLLAYRFSGYTDAVLPAP
jgi:uncharacterized SAM-binding protein YcdF (DUF218 family)